MTYHRLKQTYQRNDKSILWALIQWTVKKLSSKEDKKRNRELTLPYTSTSLNHPNQNTPYSPLLPLSRDQVVDTPSKSMSLSAVNVAPFPHAGGGAEGRKRKKERKPIMSFPRATEMALILRHFVAAWLVGVGGGRWRVELLRASWGEQLVNNTA